MTFKYSNVYVENTSLVAGKIEKKGPHSKYFDKTYDKDFYFNEKSVEQAEVKLMKDSIDILLKKCNKKPSDIDLVLAGDLQNQIAASCYTMGNYNIPFLGLYSACAITSESIIIASSLIDSKQINNAICATSSHNLVSEKQFRNPIEYGAPKPKTATFTSTGGASIMLTGSKTNIRVESATIGIVKDLGFKDANNMGAVMAPGAADTIYHHLNDLKRTVKDYDLILTGDLGIYGKEILRDYIKQEYNIVLGNNYDDCGAMLYDLKKQEEITAGGSGPVCSALVNYGYVFQMLKEKKLKKVLLVPTGALFSQISALQKQNILSIAHAVSLEVVDK